MLRLLRFLGTYLIVAVAAALLLIEIWPHRPASLSGWILFLVVALPVIAVAEWLGDKLLDNPISNRIDQATRHQTLSRLGILLLLLPTLLLVAIAVFLGSYWEK
jgi:hypothetical protein